MSRSSSLSSRLRYALPIFVLPLAAYAPSLGAVACSSDDSTSAVDAGVDAGPDADLIDQVDDDASLPDSGPVTSCDLSEAQGDPVALCTQKTVLQGWNAGARISSGVALEWAATGDGPVADGGALVHDVFSDAAYAAALARYQLAASCYGDTTLMTFVTNELLAMQPIVVNELVTPLAEYDADPYFHLRSFSAGLYQLNEPTLGAQVTALAEAYGRALATSYFTDLGPKLVAVSDAGAGGGDAGDAGLVADAGDAGDAALTDAGDAGAPLDDGILGTKNGATITYVTGDAASGATALLDLAALHLTDDPADAALWEAAAIATLDHLYSRARDASGFYYAGGTTQVGATLDTPTDVAGPPGFTFSTDTQGRVAAAFSQAGALAARTPGLLRANAYPLAQHGLDLFALIRPSAPADAGPTGPQLYDSTNGGFFASIAPSTGAVDTSRTVLGNAAMFRFLFDEGTQTVAAGTALLLQSTLMTSTANGAGFLGILQGQNDYIPAATSAYAALPSFSGNYSSRATSQALDALDYQLPSTCQ